MRHWQPKVLLAVCSLLLGVGLFAPCMTIHPAFGKLTPLIRFIDPDLTTPTSFSIVEGIRSMFSEGNFFVGLIVLVFSVLFPLWKLGVDWQALTRLEVGQPLSASLRHVNALGKWSMLDVLVLAVLVVAVKGLPGGTRVTIEWGALAFCASVLLGIGLSFIFTADRLTARDDPAQV